MKKQKGITLIALVITIIVLLILAGVTIYMLTGPNGVITNSQKAKLENIEKGAIEKINLGLNGIKTEILAQLADDPTYDPTSVENAKKLEEQGVTGIEIKDGYAIAPTPAVEKTTTITITFTTDEYQKLKKSLEGNNQENAKVEGSINLENNTITSATVTNGAS